VTPPGEQKIVCQDATSGLRQECPSKPQTGERTLMSYLVKPLRDQFMRSFREK